MCQLPTRTHHSHLPSRVTGSSLFQHSLQLPSCSEYTNEHLIGHSCSGRTAVRDGHESKGKEPFKSASSYQRAVLHLPPYTISNQEGGFVAQAVWRTLEGRLHLHQCICYALPIRDTAGVREPSFITESMKPPC